MTLDGAGESEQPLTQERKKSVSQLFSEKQEDDEQGLEELQVRQLEATGVWEAEDSEEEEAEEGVAVTTLFATQREKDLKWLEQQQMLSSVAQTLSFYYCKRGLEAAMEQTSSEFEALVKGVGQPSKARKRSVGVLFSQKRTALQDLRDDAANAAEAVDIDAEDSVADVAGNSVSGNERKQSVGALFNRKRSVAGGDADSSRQELGDSAKAAETYWQSQADEMQQEQQYSASRKASLQLGLG